MIDNPAYDCEECVRVNPGENNEIRRDAHCGLLPKERWTGEQPSLFGRPKERAFGSQGWGCDECPGTVCRTLLVADGARAHLWFSKHQLAIIYPNPPYVVTEAVETMSRAQALCESEYLKKD